MTRALVLLLPLTLIEGCQSVHVAGYSDGGTSTGGSGTNSTGGSTTGATTGAGSTTGGPCPTGDVRINGVCVLEGHACGPETVWVGDTCLTQDCAHNALLQCQAADGGVGRCLSGGCYDPRSDPENCGSFGNLCPPGSTCIDAECILADGGFAGCEPPYILRNFLCVLPSCGPADDNQACVSAASGVNGFCCGERCIAPDANDCGSCGLRCAASAVCYSGLCLPTEPSCADAGLGAYCEPGDGGLGLCCQDGCSDVTSDPLNCGGCNQSCARGATCKDSKCSAGCQSDHDCAAGKACVVRQGARICLPLACGGRPDVTDCADGDGGLGFCCSGQCTPVDSTCGTCHVCGPGEFCGPSGCTPYVDCAIEQPPASGNVYEWLCLTGAGALGLCCDSTCEELDAGCNAPSRCSPGPFAGCLLGQGEHGACCGDACVDLEQDPNNCGGCGNACASGVCAFYQRGQLPQCLPAGMEGDCLMSCPVGESCVHGVCALTACPGEIIPPRPCAAENGTIGLCCGVGVCAHPLDDPENCGTCGNACPDGQSCVNGSCTGFPGCGLGHQFWYCGDAGDENQICCPSAGCTNLLVDDHNCGFCGLRCLPAQTCSDGGCVFPAN